MSRVSVATSHRLDWIDRAACRGMQRLDPTLFNPELPSGQLPSWLAERIDQALAICAGCPVRVPCGRYGEAARATGVWGGHLRVLDSRGRCRVVRIRPHP